MQNLGIALREKNTCPKKDDNKAIKETILFSAFDTELLEI